MDSLLAQSNRDFEIIVVDNGSSDGTAGFIEERYADSVRLVTLPSNLGYAEGNNEGIRASRGRFVILLNNDTEMPADWLAEVAAAIERHPDVAMFTPKILNFFRRGEIDNTGHLIYPDGLARGRHRLEKDDGRFDEEGEAAWPSGCAGVYRRDLLDAVGLLDSSFFAYAEDVDLGLRARRAGFSCVYVPRARVFHKYSATSGGYSATKAFLVERNRFWVLLKTFPARDIAFSFFATAWRYLMHLRAAISGRGAAGKARESVDGGHGLSIGTLLVTVLRAEWAGLMGTSRILRERKKLSAGWTMSDKEFRGLLRQFRLTAYEAAMKE